jgi:hypothetical protein
MDRHGQQVAEFRSALRNASRLGAYADLILQVFQSGVWRQYQTGLDAANWRAHEFDYFLISCDAQHADMVRILAWDTFRKTNIAESMLGPPNAHRRTLMDASAAWQPRMGPTLIDLARRNGWLTQGAQPHVKRAVSDRAVMRAQHGITFDEHARQGRRQQLAPDRRRVLEDRAATLINEIPDPVELRYLLDLFRAHLAGLRGRPSRRAQWRRDIAAAKGDRATLAARWNLNRKRVRERLARVALDAPQNSRILRRL